MGKHASCVECGRWETLRRGMCDRCYQRARRRAAGMKERPKGITMVMVNCAWCFRKFEQELRVINQNKKMGSVNTCGSACKAKWRNAKVRGLGPKMVMLQCAACGNVVEKPLQRFNEAVKRGREMVCDAHCSGKYSHGKRYDGPRMRPRLVENMKVK